MKKIFSKLGILMTLIFSFLLSFFPNSKVSAANSPEIYTTYVDIVSTTRSGDTITFVTKDKLKEVLSITYEYTYYVNDVLTGYLAYRTEEFKKVNDSTYSFDVESNVIGVKIHTVRYVVADKDGIWTDDQTTGNNYIGDVNAKYRKHFVEIEDIHLEVTNGHTVHLTTTYSIQTIFNRVYFNFKDLDVEKVTAASVDYHYYEHHVRPSINIFNGFKKETNTAHENRTYNATVDNNKEYDYSLGQSVLMCAVHADCDGKYKRIEIDVSDKEEYDWYIQLPDTAYESHGINNSTRQVIDNAQIVKISYWDDGTFYKDVTTLSPNTGWIEYEETEKPEIPTWLIILMIAIGLFTLGLIAMFVKPVFNGIKVIVVGVWRIIKTIFKILWFIIKYTIGLPIVILIRSKEKT